MLCCDCHRDVASVYYDYTDASVVPNYGDFSNLKIFSISRYISRTVWVVYLLLPQAPVWGIR